MIPKQKQIPKRNHWLYNQATKIHKYFYLCKQTKQTLQNKYLTRLKNK